MTIRPTSAAIRYPATTTTASRAFAAMWETTSIMSPITSAPRIWTRLPLCRIELRRQRATAGEESSIAPVPHRFVKGLTTGPTGNCPKTVVICRPVMTCCSPARTTARPCDDSWCSSGVCCRYRHRNALRNEPCLPGGRSRHGRSSACEGSGCGDDVLLSYKDRHCDGTSTSCNGDLQDSGDWSAWEDCKTHQRCNPISFACQNYIFNDEIRCVGLDRYYYNACGVQEDYINTCNACTVDACASAGCSQTPYDCNEHGTCNDDDNICTCTDTAYTGDYCAQCAAGYYEYPATSGLCVDDPCLPDPCNGHGSCDNSSGSAVCDCEDAYSGSAVCDVCGGGLL